MRVLCDMPEYLVEEIRGLIEKKRYSSLDAFLRISAENQLVLEKEGPVLEHIKSPIMTNEAKWNKSFTDIPTGKHIKTLSAPRTQQINIANESKEINIWMWGQVNRILPLKFLVRALNVLIPEGGSSRGCPEFS